MLLVCLGASGGGRKAWERKRKEGDDGQKANESWGACWEGEAYWYYDSIVLSNRFDIFVSKRERAWVEKEDDLL